MINHFPMHVVDVCVCDHCIVLSIDPIFGTFNESLVTKLPLFAATVGVGIAGDSVGVALFHPLHLNSFFLHFS